MLAGNGTSLNQLFAIMLRRPPFSFLACPAISRPKKALQVGLLVASITRISTMAYTSIR